MPTDASNESHVAAKRVYRFGDFEVRPESGELFRDGSRVRVQEQSLQILLALLENPGSVVTRDQLRERLWPTGTYVDFEHSLNAAVKRLRAALEDDVDCPRYVETLPKRGYRFVVNVCSEEVIPTRTAVAEVPSTAKQRSAVSIVVTLILTAGAIALLWGWRSGAFFHAKASREAAGLPQNAEAYELYLRSLGYNYEFPANRQAIDLLERSTSLDQHSARSWYELARRYDVEFINTARGHGFLEQAREANRQSLELAPDFSPARLQKVMLDVQGGQLFPAYQAALTMAQQRPNDADAHFALAYALRHGGMFEEAAVECDRALELDPSNAIFRPCALVSVLLGRYDRALPYVNLDPLSSYARFRRMELAILRSDKAGALVEARSIRVDANDYPDARLMEAALSGAPAETVRYWSQQDEALNDKISLPELHFVDARYQAWAGQTGPALRLLRRAIANNYCSYPIMDSDPFLANVRRMPEYKKLRQAGIACRENFRSQMSAR